MLYFSASFLECLAAYPAVVGAGKPYKVFPSRFPLGRGYVAVESSPLPDSLPGRGSFPLLRAGENTFVSGLSLAGLRGFRQCIAARPEPVRVENLVGSMVPTTVVYYKSITVVWFSPSQGGPQGKPENIVERNNVGKKERKNERNGWNGNLLHTRQHVTVCKVDFTEWNPEELDTVIRAVLRPFEDAGMIAGIENLYDIGEGYPILTYSDCRDPYQVCKALSIVYPTATIWRGTDGICGVSGSKVRFRLVKLQRLEIIENAVRFAVSRLRRTPPFASAGSLLACVEQCTKSRNRPIGAIRECKPAVCIRPGEYENHRYYDVTACYHSLLRKLPTPDYRGGNGNQKLEAVPLDRQSSNLWQSLLEEIAEYKDLRTAMYGAMLGSLNPDKTRKVFRNGAIERVRLPTPPGTNAAAIVYHVACEIGNIAIGQCNPPYAYTDCVVTDKNPPAIWSDMGLTYKEKYTNEQAESGTVDSGADSGSFGDSSRSCAGISRTEHHDANDERFGGSERFHGEPAGNRAALLPSFRVYNRCAYIAGNHIAGNQFYERAERSEPPAHSILQWYREETRRKTYQFAFNG